MTTATVVDPDLETATEPEATQTAADEAAAAQAFAEGFKDDASEPTTTPATGDEPKPSQESTEAGKTEPEAGTVEPVVTPEPPKVEYVQVSKEDWEKTQNVIVELQGQVKRVADEAGGKIGGLTQLVNQLKASTPRGQKVEVTAEDFKELQEEFPLLVDSQLKAFNRVLGKLHGTGAPVETPAVPPTQPVVDLVRLKHEVRQENARADLDEEHADWREVVGLPAHDGAAPPDTEYRRWLAKKPQAEQDRVLSTNSPRIIAASLKEFKDSKLAKPKTTPTDTDAAARRARLQSAANPRSAGGSSGGGGGATTEEQAFREGFSGK